MGSSDFYVDYNIEVSAMGDEFKRETERRLQELASSHSDMVGAAVALEKTADTQTYDLYRVRIVVYKRSTGYCGHKTGCASDDGAERCA